jgi:hypothetical protein
MEEETGDGEKALVEAVVNVQLLNLHISASFSIE